VTENKNHTERFAKQIVGTFDASKNWRFHLTLWDVLVGLPAGLLVFMATVLFSTLLSPHTPLPVFVPPVLLAVSCLLVGILTGITRLRQGPATGMVAGIVTAGILCYLWLVAAPGDQFNPLVIGPAGMLISLLVCPTSGWLGARLRKAL